jgi:hypothetical protein
MKIYIALNDCVWFKMISICVAGTEGPITREAEAMTGYLFHRGGHFQMKQLIYSQFILVAIN